MRSRYKIINPEKDNVYFITSTIIEWLPVFICKDHFEIITRNLEFYREKRNLKIYAYIVMENHLHLILSGKELSAAIQAFKSFTAKELIESIQAKKIDWLLNQLAYFKAKYKISSKYQVWQEGFYPKQITDQEMFNQKVEYIHNNPVRRGYVDRAENWFYSSARELLTGVKTAIGVDRL
jgi:putative transposase